MQKGAARMLTARLVEAEALSAYSAAAAVTASSAS